MSLSKHLRTKTHIPEFSRLEVIKARQSLLPLVSKYSKPPRAVSLDRIRVEKAQLGPERNLVSLVCSNVFCLNENVDVV